MSLALSSLLALLLAGVAPQATGELSAEDRELLDILELLEDLELLEELDPSEGLPLPLEPDTPAETPARPETAPTGGRAR